MHKAYNISGGLLSVFSRPAQSYEFPLAKATWIYALAMPRVKRNSWTGYPLDVQQSDADHSGAYRFARMLNAYAPLNHSPSPDDSIDLDDDEDYEPVCTAVMRTRKKIYHEVCDYLYGHGRFGLELYCHPACGYRFANARASLDEMQDAAPIHFGALRYTKRLEVLVSTDSDEIEICNAHRLVCILADRLAKSEVLIKLNIYLDIYMPGDRDCDMSRSFFRSELRSRKHDAISRHHIAAFVVDPLRALRLTHDAEITIHFPGFGIAALKDVPDALTKDMTSSSLPGNYRRFSSFLDAFETSLKTLRLMFSSWVHVVLDQLPHKMRVAVIRCNRSCLGKLHEQYLREALAALKPNPSAPAVSHRLILREDLTEQDYTNLGRHFACLSMALPRADQIPSDSGPLLIDAALRASASRQR
ncbi:hypothetical protein LTR56_014834 [Elasticomyces elasticus]|nr:hypothetical protein LTR56_014834 [Elasticomyces elasticus]KAK3644707.1 hypothetical protein LTR22_015082 [Elasticomyces elasticus]KAK4916092.1 hypothetical protein LTR49_015866 [Elasticomyces elasticus]KAK5755169.1 hypothetical protein LTS12_014733 [Elasticomyces elasticus]